MPKDRCCVTIELNLSGEDVGVALGRDDVMPFLRGVVGAQSSYELDLELFEYVMGHLVETARDPRADAEVKLDADELITKWVTRFRKALHGGA